MVTVVGQDPSIKKRVTCKECGSILEFVPNEVKHYSVGDYGGGSDDYYYIVCPTCSSKVYTNSYGR